LDISSSIDHKNDLMKVRLLLLGPGESGKSTIFRQMKLLYGDYNKEEKERMTQVVHSNVISTIKTLILQARLYGFVSDEDQAYYDFLLGVKDMSLLNSALAAIIKIVWEKEPIQRAWKLRHEFQVVESMSFFLNDIGRISSPGYMANAQDILHARLRSTGITVDRFTIDGSCFEMYDVGGQRNERKKWIHCFDNVNAIIFVVALNEYDQMLFEDEATNRMTDAIGLFRDLCSHPGFERFSFILFLNKKDLYEIKIREKDIAEVADFCDYSGPAFSYNHGIKYFLEKFRELKRKDQTLWHHVTCATDTSNIRVVFNYSKDAILRSVLENRAFV